MPLNKIIILILWPALLFGGQKEHAVELIQKAQKTIKTLDPAPCPYCPEPPPLSSPEQCRSDICGEPSREVNWQVDFYSAQMKAGALMVSDHARDEKMWNLFSRYRDFQYPKLKLVEAIAYAKKSNSKLSDFTNAMANLNFFFSYASKLKVAGSHKDSEDKIIIDFDLATTRKNLRMLSTKNQDWLIKAADFFYYYYINSTRQRRAVKILRPDAFLSIIYPGKDKFEALKEESDLTEQNIVKIETLPFLMQYFAGDKLDLIQTAVNEAKQGKISENFARMMFQFNDTLEFHKEIYRKSDDNPFYQRPNPTLSQIILRDRSPATMVRRLSNEDPESTAERQTTNENCYETYLMDRELLPTEDEVVEAKKDAADAKNLVRNNFLPHLSEQTRKVLAPVIDKINFDFPITKNQLEKNFSQLLETMINNQNRTSNLIKGLSIEQTADFTAYSLLVNRFPKTTTDETPEDADLVEQEKEAGKWCAGFKYPPLSDGNVTALGNVVISYSVTKSAPEIRKGVFMHEIGHSIYGFLSDKDSKGISDESAGKFADKTQCLSRQHREAIPPEATKKAEANKIPIEKYYSDDDFADLVSSISGKVLSSSNWACGLQNAGPMAVIEDVVSPPIFTARKDDVHSSNFFRLVNVQNLMGKPMPPSCLNYIKAAGGSFEDCTTK